MIQRILIALDYSPQSTAAVAAGLDLAQQLGAEAIVITVLDVADLRVAMRAGLSGFADDADVHRAVRRWIRTNDKTLLGASACKRIIARGIPAQAIVAAAKRRKVGMIVMGPSGIGRKLFGSVTKEVLRHAAVPVLVVPRP